MRQKVIVFLFLFLPLLAFTQIGDPSAGRGGAGEQQTKEEQVKAPATEYKIISFSRDTTFVDTTLHILKDYKFNYLRRDRFELLPFSNVGQTYNKLAYDFYDDNLMPQFGARARHFNFMEAEDISYYHVPTPLTELYFRTVYEQGQTLDAFFSVNTSPNFNFSIAYKGSRSLGRYQHILTSTGNFRATVSYNTPDERYYMRTHFVSQDLMNEENGGLQPQALEQYIAKDPQFDDRARLDVNFEDAENVLFGKRFFLDHHYSLIKTEERKLSVGHLLNFSDKKYRYEQDNPSSLFGPSFENVNIRDEVNLEHIYNEAGLEYSDVFLGDLKVKGAHTSYNYGYDAVLDLESGFIPNRLLGDIISAGATYQTTLGDFDLMADGMINVSGDFEGNYLKSRLSYKFSETSKAAVGINRSERAPDYNFLLYQSDYINYNWFNDLSNITTQRVDVSFTSSLLGEWSADYSDISAYTYFGLNEEGDVKPLQYGGKVNYFRVKAMKEFRVGKFALTNTLLYQDVMEGDDVLNVPSFVTRNSLYYSDHWFRRALFLQTGFTLNYFTDFHMNGYDPVLAEFYVQNHQEMSGFPTVDFFFNGKIKQARIFFKLEHLNSLIEGNNNFSAPLYPYGDFALRFGLVWNFFL